MEPSKRREMLRWAVASLLGAALARPRFALARPASASSLRDGPRYFVSIFLSGGIDPIYTTDPKVRADVVPWVDVPYGQDAIVEAGAIQLGPHFAPFADVVSRMAILKGVQLRTANHITGAEQFLRLRTGVRPGMPSLLQLLGERRDGQAMGCMDWPFGASQLSRLFGDTPPDDLRRLGRVLRAGARRVLGDGSRPENRVTAGSLEETADLFERVAGLAPFRPERWAATGTAQSLAVSLQRILWLLENDLTRCFELNVAGELDWDTHTFNAEGQTKASVALAMIARFFGELSRRRNGRGPLAAQTLVLMGSEIGRFPALNAAQGKDHFPEAPFVLFGAGVDAGGGKGAAYGRTGPDMAARPVSPRTGRDASSGGHAVVLDDLGTTLLHLGGVSNPRVYGYEGRVLEFLVGA